VTETNGAANIVPAMTVDEGAAKALALIEEYDYVSFAQLGREIPSFSAQGHEATLICIGNDVFWAVTSFGDEVFTDEFKGRVDGWYWQWRRVRFGEVMGRGFWELHGPFVTEALANADRKASPDPFEKMKSS
jgi:hypothetical protein